MDFQEKKRLRKFFYSAPIIGALVVVLLLVTSATWEVYKKYQETKKELDIVSEQLAELQVREQYTRKEVEQLETQKGIEKEIRETYGFVKENEGVIMVVEPREIENEGQGKSANGGILGAVWRGIKNMFK